MLVLGVRNDRLDVEEPSAFSSVCIGLPSELIGADFQVLRSCQICLMRYQGRCGLIQMREEVP